MKRFFPSLILLILLLCHNVSTSQAQTNQSGEPNPPPPAAAPEQQNNTDENPDPHQEQTNVKNEAVVGDESAPLVERVKEIAYKTNWALFTSLVATAIAFLSWRASRNAVNVSANATKADLQPYISFPNTFPFDVLTPERGGNSFELHAYTDGMGFSNSGKTPASCLDIKAQGRFYAGEGRHFDEQAEVRELKKGDMVAGETWYCALWFNFPFPKGDAFSFKRIREMDIFITCTFADMFSNGKTRKYVAHYICSEMGFGAHLQSVEEKTDS